MLPTFTSEGYLPAGDYDLTLSEVRSSMLVAGPSNGCPRGIVRIIKGGQP